MTQIGKSDAQIRKELADGARDLINDRSFKAAVGILELQWRGEMEDPALVDRDKIMDLRARLMALKAIPQMLQHLIASEKMAQRSNHA
jgi:predicted lipid carrier protein YhbT